MPYNPKHQPQLTGIATSAVDCGPRSVQMAIDWATEGQKVPSIKNIRSKMGIPSDTTNTWDWQKAIESYSSLGDYEPPIPTRLLNGQPDWSEVGSWINEDKDNHAAIVAVDYGRLRRLMPAKTGSETFDGYHAIFIRGGWQRDAEGPLLRKSFDSLLDGRYPGCPNGPVWVPNFKLSEAVELVGKKERGTPGVYALLLARPEKIGGVTVPPEAPSDPELSDGGESPTLASVYADINELAAEDLDIAIRLATIVADLESVMGFNPLADATTPVEPIETEPAVQ